MKMKEEEFETLVDNYIAFELSDRGSVEYQQLFPVFEQVEEMCRDDPDSTWALILAALERNASNAFMETLAAGLLEDFLARHGRYMIDTVEQEAKNNRKFCDLLGRVCEHRLEEDIWLRTKAVLQSCG